MFCRLYFGHIDSALGCESVGAPGLFWRLLEGCILGHCSDGPLQEGAPVKRAAAAPAPAPAVAAAPPPLATIG